MARLNDQTTVEINITGTMTQPTINGEVSARKRWPRSNRRPTLRFRHLRRRGPRYLQRRQRHTSLFIASAGIPTALDPALNGVDFHSFFHVSPDPVIDANSNTAILDWNFDAGGTTFEFLADGETLTLTYTVQVTDLDGATNDQTTVEITITGTNDAPTITGGPVSKNN